MGMEWLPSLLVGVGTLAGLWLILDFSPVEGLHRFRRSPTLKRHLLEVQGKRQENFVQAQFRLARETLEITGRRDAYPRYFRRAVLLGILGAGAGMALLNPLMAAVLAAAGLLAPMLAVQLSAASFQTDGRAVMYTALSLVTGAFERTGDPVTAVRESVKYMDEPMQSVFRDFLHRYRQDSSVAHAMAAIRGRLDQRVWQEWCDAMLQCYDDPGRAGLLREIVQNCGRQNSIQTELASILKQPHRDIIRMVLLVVLPVPLLCLPAYTRQILLGTWQGKLSLGAVAAAALYAVYRGVHASRPLDMEKAAGL